MGGWYVKHKGRKGRVVVVVVVVMQNLLFDGHLLSVRGFPENAVRWVGTCRLNRL